MRLAGAGSDGDRLQHLRAVLCSWTGAGHSRPGRARTGRSGPARHRTRGGKVTTAVLRDATHWDEVVTALGYGYLRRHDLRHTGLTWMEGRGAASDASFPAWCEEDAVGAAALGRVA
jgi:integrase